MAMSAQFHACTGALTCLDLLRESLFEIARATERDPEVQQEVGEAFQHLDAAISLLRGETV